MRSLPVPRPLGFGFAKVALCSCFALIEPGYPEAMSSSAPHPRFSTGLLVLGALLALHPATPAAAALVGGAALALTLGHGWQRQVQAWTHRLLPLAVVGLGADMNLRAVAKAGLHGLGYTALSILLVLALG